MPRSLASVFNRITFFSTASGKDLIAVEHLLSGSTRTNVQLTVAWEKGKVKGKKKIRNDLALPAHEKQMFYRTPRNPLCTRGIIPTVFLTATRPAGPSNL